MSPNNTFNLEWVFTYHSPSPEQLPLYANIRKGAKEFAQIILDNSPQGADQAASIRLLRECVMTANAAIALEGSFLGPSPQTPKQV